MSHEKRRIVSLCALLAWAAGPSLARAQNLAVAETAGLAIDAAARGAQAGDEVATRELAARVVAMTQLDAPLVAALNLNDRLTRAELKARQSGATVTERHVLTAFNRMVHTMKLPHYAKASPYEVRMVRMGVFVMAPQLLAAQPVMHRHSRPGPALKKKMTPAEALLVTTLLAQQKLTNKSFQMTRGERQTHWAEVHDHPLTTLTSDWTPKSQQLVKLAVRAFKGMSQKQALAETDAALVHIGIPR